MHDRELNCLASPHGPLRRLHPIRPSGLAAFLDQLSPIQARFLRDGGFAANSQDLRLLPGTGGIESAVIGLGDDRTPYAFGDLAQRLPEHTAWELAEGDYHLPSAVLGFLLGAYRYVQFKPPSRKPALLRVPDGMERVLAMARATWMVRDLINAPASLLGPRDLAEVVARVGEHHGATVQVIEGQALELAYPAIAAVGCGSSRAPCVAVLCWSGSAVTRESPLVSLCGKGVCFDSGGYDLKPSAGMLRMKKDMGGAATAIGIAQLIMEADLPIRLELRVGCAENSVSGAAMRPLDVLRTRRGLTVEVGNTDAEGRLVLCDLLAEASDRRPALLVDFATLTGAARVALGPDLPALFCNDETWAERLIAAGRAAHDPLWHLPLWDEYESWLESPIADVNNVASKPYAGAIVGALFLRRFVARGVPWAHVDLYAWADQNRPGRPEGGEAQAMRGVFSALTAQWGSSQPEQVSNVIGIGGGGF